MAALFHEVHKKGKVDRTFNSCNFSFILSGHGFYRDDSGRQTVSAPCVFIQRPGVHHEYGPDGTWEEFSILYPPDLESSLFKIGYLRQHHDFWPIMNLARLMPWIEELVRLRRNGHQYAFPDRIDRLADLLISESLQQRPPLELSPSEAKAEDLRQALRADPAQTLDLSTWLAREGLSESTFRRAWARLTNPSPARYQRQLRHHEACRLLVETSLPVQEIAARVGYEDALYFSRQFRQVAGITPTGYRRQQQSMLAAFEEND